MDLSRRERRPPRRLYGMGDQATDDFARQCLLARRFVEAGVRFVELYARRAGTSTGSLKDGARPQRAAVDKPIAGLLADLKARGPARRTRW